MNRRWKVLVIEHTDMVQRIASMMTRRLPVSTDVGDLIGHGNLALIDCAKRFERSRGVPFEAFAYKRVKGAMLHPLRCANSGMDYAFQLHEEPKDGPYEDPMPEARAEAAWIRPKLQAALRSLTPEEKVAILMLAEGKYLREIGDYFDRSASWAHALVQSARRKLQAALATYGIESDAA